MTNVHPIPREPGAPGSSGPFPPPQALLSCPRHQGWAGYLLAASRLLLVWRNRIRDKMLKCR